MRLSIYWRQPLRSSGALAALLLLAAGTDVLSAQQKAPKPKKQLQSTDHIFTNAHVFRIQIQIPEEDVETLRGYRWQGFRAGEAQRPSVKGTVREGGRVYTNVAIHLKGAAGSFRSVDQNPSLTLNFDKHVKGQTFQGLERFSLNNSVQDRSFLNEQICRELFAAAGVPVPRAAHATVELNGRALGVYVLVEAFNKQFLARHFKSANGNLYDGGFLKDITDPLQKSSGGGPEDLSDLRRLAEAAKEPDLTNRLERLNQVLDVDRFITFLALDIMMCNWDGYALNRNNYRIYHDPGSDKIVFMPHGLDQMFGVLRVGTDMPLFPRMHGVVARGVMQPPEGRRQYRERISQLLTNLFQVEVITNRVWQSAAKLRPVLEEQGSALAASHDREVAQFCNRIVDRVANIRQQLAGPDKALPFDSAGVARFADWTPRIESGKPVLREQTEGGRKLLHVGAPAGSAVGVWSTRVKLPPGSYRLEGKVKSQGVTVDPGDRRGGAGLRTRDHRPREKMTGTSDWTDVRLDFEIKDAPSEFGFLGPIQDELPEVELMCELRAAKGEAWFDRDSLRLVRR